jgi:hypothetical protein
VRVDRRTVLQLAASAAGGLLGAPIVLPPAAHACTTRTRFASTRLRVPDRQNRLASTSLAALWRQSAGSPAYTVRNPRVCLPGFWCTNAGGTDPTERLNAGTFEVAYALEINGVRHRATFNGRPWTTRGGTGADQGYATAFDWGVWSDPIPVELPANANFFHCTLLKLPVADALFPAALRLSPLIGDRARVAADASTLEPLLTGSDPIVSAGASPSVVYAPMFMVAESDARGPVVLIIGDSRAYGRDELGSGNLEPRAAAASVERGLDSVEGGRVATGNITVPGSSPGKSTQAPGLDHRVTPLLELGTGLPFTHIVDQHGNNGLLTWEGLVGHVEVVKQHFPGIPYVKVTIPPRVGPTTADAYRTLAGQSPNPFDSYPSGARALFNNDVLANRDGLFDAVFHAGKYGMAGDSTDFERSRFPEFADRKGALTRDWAGSNPLYVNFAPLYGDRLNFDPANRSAGGLVQSVVPSGTPGEWEVRLEGGHSGGTYAAGASFACTPTSDGTHESPRMHMIEAVAYEDLKRAGLLGRIGVRPR